MIESALQSALSSDIFRERLRELCLHHHGFVRQACRRYVQNTADADDLAQEVLLKAAQGFDAFRGASGTSTWIYRVAVNHCADHLRRQRRRLGMLRLYAADLQQLQAPCEPESNAALRRLLDELRRRLDTPDRRIAYLRFEMGMKQGGIARKVGMSRAVVAGRLRKIQERAVKLYWGEGGGQGLGAKR